MWDFLIFIFSNTLFHKYLWPFMNIRGQAEQGTKQIEMSIEMGYAYLKASSEPGVY